MVSDDVQRHMLQTMMTIREFESKVQERFADGAIPGFVHLYIGEEAIATGVCQALEDRDYIASTHRGHGHCLARGLDPKHMMAELYGKATGYCDGKGGSMHIADVDAGMLGANGIVAAGIPIAGGAALTASMTDDDHVAAAFFGDAGTSQGSFHETFNLAGIWDLPLIGIIENNQYGEMSGLEDHHPESSLDDLTVYGEPYGIVRRRVDGMDVEAVYEATREAVDYARDGEGAVLIECETYRFEGHHEGDTEFYRDEDEIEDWKQRDPLRTYPEQLKEQEVITQEELEEMREEIQAEIQEAITFAEDSPYPAPEEAYEGLYSEGV